MKHFVLIFSLVFFSGFYSKAQQSKAREIVNVALKKLTGGKALRQYEVQLEYDKPGIVPSYISQSESVLQMIDSIKSTLPDSTRKIFELAANKGEAEKNNFIEELYAGKTEKEYVDLVTSKIAVLHISYNQSKGKNDTVRYVRDLQGKNGSAGILTSNPIAFLQFISDSVAELKYKEKAKGDNNEFDIIQMKTEGKWQDIYFDKKSHVLKRIDTPYTNGDPLMGTGKREYKTSTLYSNYQKQNGFLLPGSMETIDNQFYLAIKYILHWSGINAPLPQSVFAIEPSYEDRMHHKIFEIGQDLYVLEESGNSINQRSLIKRNPNGNIQMFAGPGNLDSLNKKQMNMLKSKFQECQISDIFSISNISGFVSLSSFLSKNTHIYVPKDAAFMEEQNINLYGNTKEDSIHKDLVNKGLFTIFDTEFEANGVKSIVLNPVRKDKFDHTFVVYYLPDEKVIYMYGNPYSADSSSKNAKPREKMMYDLIKEKSLSVEKIVYSGSYLDNAPLFMTFKDFESRINNTDFSVYDNVKR